jgi:hypothetical protein
MMSRWGGVVLAAGLAVATCWGAGCGTHASNGNGPNKNPGTSMDASNSVDTGPNNVLGGGVDAAGPQLTIQPQNATLMVTAGGSSTLQFNAYLPGSQTPTQAEWSLQAPGAIGTIDANGLFTASGQLAGGALIGAQAGTLHASTQLTVSLGLQDNPGMIATGTQQSLMAGGTADPAFAWLYPYNGTVFPQGLLAPTLQFAGTAPDAVYVHVSFGSFDYKGFYGPSTPGQVTFTQQLWTTITQSATGSDLVQVQVTKISGGQVSGPITESWTIAQGSLRGTVYYNSYDSPLANGGAVLSLQPGATSPTVLMGGASGCVVCHSVSADGSTIVAGHQHSYDACGDLTNNNNQLSQIPVTEGNHVMTLAGMYPDGTKAVTCDNCVDYSWTNGNISPSELINPKTGQAIPSTGLVPYAATPSFSSDGKMLAFNVYDGQGAQWGNSNTTSTPGTSLGFLSFDTMTNTFSNLQMISMLPTPYAGWNPMSLYPTWPVFTPDNTWVVFMLGTKLYTRSPGTMDQGPTANLAILHVPSGTTALLDQLNGYNTGGATSYLPFGTADENMNYEPTILPVAVGGYFWVVFTSRREYGNTINASDPWAGSDGTNGPAVRKKLWVAALTIGSSSENPVTSAVDISHPPFYLPGQELGGGNSRGFWALSPCQQTGVTCQTGDQCCTGFCRQTAGDAGMPAAGDAGADAGAAAFVCVPPQACANQYEKCTTTADCCQASAGVQCIGGFCAQPSQ